MKKGEIDHLTPVGWREWISIPQWGVEYIKVKVDTGARTSSIHVQDIEEFRKEGTLWVRFKVFPFQKSTRHFVLAEAPVIDTREVRSSSGHQEMRPVVKAEFILSGIRFEGEITLTNRDQMGFRMLLGREALKERFFVLAGKSYMGGKPPAEILKKNRRNK